MTDLAKLHKINQEWRAWMDANTNFKTPDTLDTLRYMRIEANEAADVELRQRLPGHARNNGREHTVFQELADTAMLALTAIPAGYTWHDDWQGYTAGDIDFICEDANLAVIRAKEGSTASIASAALVAEDVIRAIGEYPGMDLEAELLKCHARLKAKHSSAVPFVPLVVASEDRKI